MTPATQYRILEELRQLVAFPSISTDPRYAWAVRACADWLAGHLRGLGLAGVRVFETSRHPIVYAERLVSPARPTLLIYGHYDVQPVAPAAAWTVPPFGGVVRANCLYGRGASDDKGQFFTHLKALEILLKTGQPLPVNVKILLEGEEEIGSPNLGAFIRRHRRLLRADCAVLSDTNLLSADQPALTFGLRGSFSAELEVRGPRTELHSGVFGGAVLNPLQALCELLAGLHGPHGRVRLSGFYKDVQPTSTAERTYAARHAPPAAQLLREAGVGQGWGEAGYSLYERTTLRPSLSITGLSGGYAGAGTKLIIPPVARAKLSFRLAAGQNPHAVERQLRAYLARHTPPQVRATLTAQLHAKPYLVAPDHPAMRAAARAYAVGFGREPVLQRSGGTIPVAVLLEEVLGLKTVLMGFGLPGDRKHGPDEFLYLPNFWRGIQTSLAFMHDVARSLRYVAPRKSGPPATRVAQAALAAQVAAY